MLTDNKYTLENTASPARRSVHAPTNKRWSDTQKIEAVTTWLMLGNLRATSRVLEIPEVTLLSWKKSEWWQEVVREITTQENLTLSNKLKKIVDKSLDIVTDRMENGDFIYDQKTGKLVRKPMLGKDVHKIAMDSLATKTKMQQIEVHQQVSLQIN